MRSVRAFVACVALLAAGCATVTPIAPGTPPRGARIVPAAVPGDCSRDVTVELQAFVDAAPDGSTLVFTRDACYRVDGTLRFRGRNHLLLEGNHATFRAFTDGSELVDPKLIRMRSLFSMYQSTGITFRNTVAVGANPYAGRDDRAYRAVYEAQHAYSMLASRSILLDHVEAYDVWGDFVNVGPGSDGVTVRDSTFSRNGRQGWNINGTNVLFERNRISETRRATIDMEPSRPSWTTRNVTIRDNWIGPGRLYFLASVGASPVMDNITIRNNHLARNMRMFVDPPKGTRSNYRIIGNVAEKGVSQQGGAALGFRDIVNLEVRDNTFPVQAGRNISGVSIANCAHVVVTGNTFLRAARPIRDLGGNVDVRQSANQIGNPPTPVPATTVAGPTPYPA